MGGLFLVTVGSWLFAQVVWGGLVGRLFPPASGGSSSPSGSPASGAISGVLPQLGGAATGALPQLGAGALPQLGATGALGALGYLLP